MKKNQSAGIGEICGCNGRVISASTKMINFNQLERGAPAKSSKITIFIGFVGNLATFAYRQTPRDGNFVTFAYRQTSRDGNLATFAYRQTSRDGNLATFAYRQTPRDGNLATFAYRQTSRDGNFVTISYRLVRFDGNPVAACLGQVFQPAGLSDLPAADLIGIKGARNGGKLQKYPPAK
jgi:hypothetical protein